MHVAFDAVAGISTADGAGDGGQRTAIAAADLVTQQAADHGAATGAQAAGALGGALIGVGRDHGAAVRALRRTVVMRCGLGGQRRGADAGHGGSEGKTGGDVRNVFHDVSPWVLL
jgi:hypothetical protein